MKPPDVFKTPNKNQVAKNGTYRAYKSGNKEALFILIYEKGHSVHNAASELKIPPSTARNWLKKEESKDGTEILGRQSESGRPVG